MNKWIHEGKRDIMALAKRVESWVEEWSLCKMLEGPRILWVRFARWKSLVYGTTDTSS